tara:strand:+ start:398 stop:1741 length:1344 start_codon:yes stop_codon:yes gene_type:complete
LKDRKIASSNHKIRDFISRHFPERQLYFRANGVVRFVSLSSRTQLLLSFVAAGILVWVGLSSYSFISKDNVLISKDQEISSLTNSYQSLQQDFETLHNEIQDTTKQLTQRQAYLEELLNAEHGNTTSAIESPAEDATTQNSTPQEQKSPGTQPNASPQQSTGPQSHATTAPSVRKPALLSRFFSTAHAEDAEYDSLSQLRQAKSTLLHLETQQNQQAERLIQKIAGRLHSIEQTLKTAGLQSQQILELLDENVSPYMGKGGPIDLLHQFGTAEDIAQQTRAAKTFTQLMNDQSRLDDLKAALASMPVIIPVERYYVSSHFGIRKDPVTKRRARHHGIDLAGWWKTPIMAPASGVVTYSGRNGAYGNFIEINHGNGFKTRYGHLGKLKVRKGDHVTTKQIIGLMGSTGRSTGPHLHYEIWFDGKPRNPMKFFKAAEHVLKIQQQQTSS